MLLICKIIFQRLPTQKFHTSLCYLYNKLNIDINIIYILNTLQIAIMSHNVLMYYNIIIIVKEGVNVGR